MRPKRGAERRPGPPEKKAKTANPPPRVHIVRAKTPVPVGLESTGPINRTYEDLVKMTAEHPLFAAKFAPHPNWVSTLTMKPSSKAKHKKIVAMDCEMCVTINEATKVRNSKTLVRVTVIDGENPDDILVDLIVHQPPAGHVVFSYKTHIHGIKEDTITSSKISEDRARKEVLKFVGPDTIVVGHSVYGDLASLGIHHTRVIDTSFLYTRKDVQAKFKTPGLRDLTKQLLAIEMPAVHDSFLDAKTTMMAATYTLTHPCGEVLYYDGPRTDTADESTLDASAVTIPVVKTTSTPVTATPVRAPSINNVDDDEKDTHWLVHKIPKGLYNSDVEQFAIQQTAVVPTMVENIVFKDVWGSCCVHFRTPGHAKLAFRTLVGKESEDPLKRPVKTLNIHDAKGKKFSNIKVVQVTQRNKN
ncbi:hypothetical protein H310_02914 [Aphanomyces invadans]|uniref:Exonuclease domain-containing protein n=1 Tax=Aphanomyces invadans TaxID=157072 RepID=A0A024ULL9_9STRA|nr:hypothetical protein H310_02914 [Aphanomyces invadans]ETW06752.1 hypothetical protein H310_02914 [Aphanomyces invadans]|eukprot:XP_008864827.1 hypothetical protein H310_02914 [Aphanomyces invadans]